MQGRPCPRGWALLPFEALKPHQEWCRAEQLTAVERSGRQNGSLLSKAAKSPAARTRGGGARPRRPQAEEERKERKSVQPGAHVKSFGGKWLLCVCD